MKRLIIFCPYPSNQAPSQRFRFEQYIDLLIDKGFKITVLSFWNQSAGASLNRKKEGIGKLFQLASSLGRQFIRTIYYTPATDLVFIHREILPIGPPILEWIIARLLKKKIIYDFDDAIWLTDNRTEGRFEKLLRWRSKVKLICKWSYKISAGNEYLASFARRYNTNTIVNPTTLDTEHHHNPAIYNRTLLRSGQVIIGWTGSHSTLKYLQTLETALKVVEDRNPEVKLLVIADKEPSLNLKNVEFIQWSKEAEVRELARADIGLMPLPDDEWTKGKCGFKALQYMALEIPALVSPVGVNSEIVDHGINGYHCYTNEDWIQYIETLIKDEQLRKKMGVKGREKVVTRYSVSSNSKNFLSLFE